jgi:hypothetical protein
MDRNCTGCPFQYLSDKPEALARQRFDQPLSLPAISERNARGIDGRRQRRLGYDAAIPHRIDQIVLANDALAVGDKVHQEIEHLGFDRNEVSAATQFAPRLVKDKVFESKEQARLR